MLKHPDTAQLRAELKVILSEYNPMTVRQVFYQMVSRGLVEKTETNYRNVYRLLADMRAEREGGSLYA